MIRLLAFTLTVAALAPLSPLGCPPTDTLPNDGTPVERGSIDTTAQAPATATAGQTVRLEATAAGGQVRYAWLQTAGPGVQILNPQRARASFVAPSLKADQRLRFMVTTRNDVGDVGRAEVDVTVAADPNYGQGTGGGGGLPVANAGPDQRVLPAAHVTLDGSASSGIDLTYRWRQLSGTTVTLSAANSVRTMFVAPAYDPSRTNVLLFELAVTDGDGHTVTDRTQVTIRDPSLSDRKVQVNTTLGSFTLELEPEKAPRTVANFLEYVDDGFYDGTLFHRVIKDFVIQGGGYTSGMVEKETRDPIINEADNGLSNVRGTVAMARAQDPDSATSQFYINLKDNLDLDAGPGQRGYTVFGHVAEGMDVVDRIAEVDTGEQEGFQDVPLEDVVIQSIRRVTVSVPGSDTGGTVRPHTPATPWSEPSPDDGTFTDRT